MASLNVNERLVKLVRVDQSIAPAVSAGALDAGTIASQAADGRFAAGAGNATRGFVLETVLTANAPVSILKKGLVDLGGALAGLNPGASVYATAAGVLDDSATSNTLVGTVEQGRGDLAGPGVQRKYLRVDL